MVGQAQSYMARAGRPCESLDIFGRLATSWSSHTGICTGYMRRRGVNACYCTYREGETKLPSLYERLGGIQSFASNIALLYGDVLTRGNK